MLMNISVNQRHLSWIGARSVLEILAIVAQEYLA